MAKKNKKAIILSAQRNELVTVKCPHCDLKVEAEVEELEGVYSYDCPCGKEVDIDFDDFNKNFIPVMQIKTITL